MPPVFPRNAAALLIGIGQYDRADRIASLRYAGRDARSLAKVLRDPEVCGFPRDRIALLTDARASRAAIDRHLSRWLPGQARGAELVFLYFAGHGVVESVAGREEGYLVPYDANPDDIVRHGIAMSDLARWIDALGAASVVVCLDCCHAGTILPQEGMSLRGVERDLVLQPSILQRLSGRGRFLLASCDRGQKSIESEELRHGLFTYHLLRGLIGAGDRDGDGYVSIAELFGYVATAVSQDARDHYQREQTPWTSATYNGDVLLSAVRPRRKPGPPQAPSTHDSGPVNQATVAEDGPLLEQLRRLKRYPDPREVPCIFRHLAHKSEVVRKQAHRALAACSWDEVVRSAEEFARASATQPEVASDSVEGILDGLAALETHARVVSLLDRLSGLLRGGLRDRAIRLLDRKRLAGDRDRLAEVFRKSHGGEIVRLLGPGTYTGAYLARLDDTGLEVVVRVLRPEFAAQPVIRGHFVELGVRAVRLVHQNLVLTRDARAFADRALYFTVRDFIPGATLREVLESGRRFEPLQSCKILRQVLDALTPLHREGLVHAGIKPSNLFLTRDDRVILGDPSLPIPASGYDLPRLAYDFRYAPPDFFRGPVPTPAADFYSLGCVAHELFRGQPPFVSENHFDLIARHARDTIPTGLGSSNPALDDWLARALAKVPDDRFADLDAARIALARLEQAFLLPAEERRARCSLPPSAPAPTMAGIVSDSPSSVHLLHEQSLMELGDRQSLMPLSQVDGGYETVGPALSHPASPRPEVPGYEILEELGRGGMGVVFKARQQTLGRWVALKMNRDPYQSEESRRRFLIEARSLALVQHPNIVTIHDLGEAQGCPFIAMEFCPGGNLASKVAGTPLGPREAALLVERLARGVQAAHEAGVLHRDLKPANVLFAGDDTPKITDFGLARQSEQATGNTMQGTVMGTPAYMAPEQARGDTEQIGPAADVYGLGAILYECLTGRSPFRSESVLDTLMKVMNEDPVPPRLVQPGVPRDLEAICLRCLEKKPEKRYASAADLAEDLMRFLEGQPTAMRARSSWRRWWPFG